MGWKIVTILIYTAMISNDCKSKQHKAEEHKHNKYRNFYVVLL